MNYFVRAALLIFLSAAVSQGDAQTVPMGKITLGAYYFDGWTGQTNHISAKLQDEFTERKPIWGWVTSTPAIVEKQIDAAADAGIDFFSFCWYYNDANKANGPMNHALNYYLAAKNQHRLHFNILVVNHGGFDIGPKEWNDLIQLWIPLMKNPMYVKANGKPLITFYSVDRLLETFGSPQAINAALEKLRTAARAAGIGEITIGATIASGDASKITDAKNSGFDLLTGYNYQGIGFKGNETQAPIKDLQAAEPGVWKHFDQATMAVIPVSTLNFDPRPWSEINPNYKSHRYYVGYSAASVYDSVSSLKHWILSSCAHCTDEKLAIMYAWNENGEGAWLTPSDAWQWGLLKNVKSALQAP